MSVYSRNDETIEDLNVGIEECAYEPGIEAAWGIVAESEANYNRIMQAVGIEELCAFESTGEEMVYEAGAVSGFIGKAKEFFTKMWEKIKGLFKKFFAMFDQFAKNDKDFINKYKAHLVKVNTKNFEYKGFKFTNLDLDIAKVYDKAAAKCPISIDPIKFVENSDIKDKSEVVEKMRGAAIGEGSLEAGEYTKELFKLFRSGEDSKETIDNISITEVLNNISSNSGLKKNAEKSYKDLEKKFKEVMKTLSKSEKDLTKDFPKGGEAVGNKVRHVNTAIYFLKEAMNITQIANGAKLTAIKDCNRQSKAICVALMNYKPKNEGFQFGDEEYDSYNEGGFLSNVVIR